MSKKAFFHLPGLFEFHKLYSLFLPLFYEHHEYFYDWCEIGSIYGSPKDCLWGGGRVELGDADVNDVLALLKKYKVSPRFTFSNSLLTKEHLSDKSCNFLCKIFNQEASLSTGIIIHSDLLLNYLKAEFTNFYFISSTTKVLTNFEEFLKELDREEFKYIVPDFRLNKEFKKLDALSDKRKDKVEFLLNECCFYGCSDRKKCYEEVSRKNLGIFEGEYICTAPYIGEGYSFSRAMENPGFISVNDIMEKYLPMGFSNFKIEGRGLGSALVLEFLLYYMVKPQYHIHVREKIYLDNMLDLF
ncbi:MAG: hypothetical protein MJZ11_04395 [Lachnospiraceae bacterium]|nr:hypothetical protein [Lachnospiraceae bacterium]